MYFLGLETSTQIGSVCLFKNEILLSEKISTVQKSHSEFVHKAIEDLLNEEKISLKDISTFAVGIGPGSFTGIRISVNTIKAYSYLLRTPIVTFDSLSLLAHQARTTTRPILSLINAYKNMNYTCVYTIEKGRVRPVRDIEAVPVQDLSRWLSSSPATNNLKQFTVVGDGYKTYEGFFEPEVKTMLLREDHVQDYPRSSAMGELFFQSKNLTKSEWKSILPLYIRASEAEENQRGLFFKPLK